MYLPLKQMSINIFTLSVCHILLTYVKVLQYVKQDFRNAD